MGCGQCRSIARGRGLWTRGGRVVPAAGRAFVEALAMMVCAAVRVPVSAEVFLRLRGAGIVYRKG